MSTEEINTRNELARDIPKWTDLPFGGVNDYVKLDANAAYAIADVLIEKGYSKPRQVSTVEELDAVIVASFEQGECLVLMAGWRPWIIWEDDYGDAHASSLPVEDDPERLTLDDISLPATVLYVGGSL